MRELKTMIQTRKKWQPAEQQAQIQASALEAAANGII